MTGNQPMGLEGFWVGLLNRIHQHCPDAQIPFNIEQRLAHAGASTAHFVAQSKRIVIKAAQLCDFLVCAKIVMFHLGRGFQNRIFLFPGFRHQ